MGDNRKIGVVNKKYDNRNNKDSNSIWSSKMKIWILKDKNDVNVYDTFIKEIKDYAKVLHKEGVTTSQIRKIYSSLKASRTTIEMKKLRPKLAYIYGKNKKSKYLTEFIEIIDYGIENLKEDDDEGIDNIKEYIETVVAYREFHA